MSDATLVLLRALGLGDFLTGIPAYHALARAFPRHRRVLAAPAVLAPLAALTGAIDAVVPTRPLEPLDPRLHGAAIAVDLHGCGPQSHRVLLDARPGCLIAFRHAAVPESREGPPHDPEEHEVARWCRLLRAYGIRADPGALELARPAVAVPAALRDATLVHVGAAAPARRWPAERWAAVVRARTARGERVVVTAGAGEADDAHRVAAEAGLPDAHVLAGRTSLVELAALVAAAGAVVCTDTGVAHLATAYGTRSVVLFGPSPPSLWGPPNRPRHRVLWAGRRGDPHADRPDPGLLLIDAGDVVAALDAVLAA